MRRQYNASTWSGKKSANIVPSLARANPKSLVPKIFILARNGCLRIRRRVVKTARAAISTALALKGGATSQVYRP